MPIRPSNYVFNYTSKDFRISHIVESAGEEQEKPENLGKKWRFLANLAFLATLGA